LGQFLETPKHLDLPTMEQLQRISIDKNILHGKPRIKGTRIPVSLILDLLSDGATPQDIITRHYPDLVLEDVLACIAYANQQ
jgi:uncharacterized protein (DUF433 family)